jgi:hypothetical protein
LRKYAEKQNNKPCGKSDSMMIEEEKSIIENEKEKRVSGLWFEAQGWR